MDERASAPGGGRAVGRVWRGSRLLGYALAWREAIELADAYRTRLRTAVLADIAAGLSVTEASRLTGPG